MAIDFEKLIDLDGLTVFKQESDKLYSTKAENSALETRIKTLEDDGSDSNVIEIIKVNNVALTPDGNKAVNVVVPTTVSELTDSSDYITNSNIESSIANDAKLPTGAAVIVFVEGKGYQTAAQVSASIESYHYATEQYVTNAIGNANHLQISVVNALPQTGSSNVIYLVPDDGGKSNKDMYIWNASSNQFVLVGNTEVDLTGYALKTDFSVATTAQIQALFAA